MNKEILKIYTGHESISGHEFIFLNENINYVKHSENVDITVTDHLSDINHTRDILNKTNPKILLMHLGTHYWENGSWQHMLNHTKICETYPNTYFLLLEHDLNILGHEKQTNNFKEIYYEYLFNYYRKLMVGIKSQVLYFSHGPAAEPSSWREALNKEIISTDRNKIFLSPNKLYPDQNRTIYRTKLFKFLYENRDLGYLSGPGRIESPGFVENLIGWTEPSLHIPTEYEGKDGELLAVDKLPPRWFAPVHQFYYNDTFITVNAETIEHGQVISPTEKTYIPLWKGHLIFTFSTYNFISSMEKLGFKFPRNFIDYSYDTITDNNLRWEAYITELKRLLSLPLDEWKNIYNNTIDIRLHNKNIFFTKPDYLVKPTLEQILNRKL